MSNSVRPHGWQSTKFPQFPRPPGFSRQEHWSGLPFPSPMHESEKWKWSSGIPYFLQFKSVFGNKEFMIWATVSSQSGFLSKMKTDYIYHSLFLCFNYASQKYLMSGPQGSHCIKHIESPLDSKEIKPVNPKGDQSWIFIGRTDAEAEAPILWPPDMKSWLIRKDPDEWRQKDKWAAKDEMIR